ncbi:MAG: putative siderophore transport system permease protein YfhA [Alphaproteobacteria bacterium MarineAlpha3_Bin7]|nr:MAG: putative siderophore transport system permease protein YfhA [Alphaproteobacteria bacterium MarineAlpha3_Bin7]
MIKFDRKALLWSVLLIFLIFVLSLLSLSQGPTFLPLDTIISSLYSQANTSTNIIIQEIRLPRTLLSIMIGAALGLSGAALQGYLRNPLAEPGIIGVSGCAALGAVIVFYSGLTSIISIALPLGGMAGAAISVLLLGLLAGYKSSVMTIILAGVAITSLAGSLTSLVLSLAPNPFATFEIFFWLLGSLADRSFEHVKLIVFPLVIGIGLLLTTGRALDALTLGEDVASSLGFNLQRIKWTIVIGISLAVGVAVSVSGIIGFVGLVVPHLLRPIADFRPGILLPLSMLGGINLTLAADILVRVVSQGPELKLGIVTALIGSPFFLYLVIKSRSKLQ